MGEYGKVGYIKMMRTPELMELISDPKAFALLALIALRARRSSSFSRHNLEIGQALIGDHAAVGLTPKAYIEAKRRLEAWGFAAFKGTNKGTIATLLDSRVFDIEAERKGERKDEHRDNPGTSTGTNQGRVTRMEESFITPPLPRARGSATSFDRSASLAEQEAVASPIVKAREAFKAMHPECRRTPDMAIENTLRAYPPDRWPEAIESMGRHYAGDAPMRKPPLAILESYLARGPREKPVAAGPVKSGRKWEFKKEVKAQGLPASAFEHPAAVAVGGGA